MSVCTRCGHAQERHAGGRCGKCTCPEFVPGEGGVTLSEADEDALLEYEVWNSRRDMIRQQIEAKEAELNEADAKAEEAWENIKHLVTCSCGGTWPCQESVWPGADTRFHHHILPKIEESR